MLGVTGAPSAAFGMATKRASILTTPAIGISRDHVMGVQLANRYTWAGLPWQLSVTTLSS
jgi:hypothetical protein